MPLPLLFITAAAASGLLGAGKTAKAISNNNKANQINTMANDKVNRAQEKLEAQRAAVSEALSELGEMKLNILNGHINDFIKTFEKIKNIDFESSLGLEELKNLHIEQKDFEELKQLGNFAAEVAGGATAGVAGGALTALGAYGAAMTFASASTGTAIATLSGAAATNATLAFFGGGSLAAGGLGMAGGAVVLGGLVAGPALMVMGLVTGAKAQEKVNVALANKAEADEIAESLNAASYQCSAIRRRTYMFYNVLAHLDSYFLQQIWAMEDIVANEGEDYRQYKLDSKKAIATVVSTACSIKAVLDTPILTVEGELTEASERITSMVKQLKEKKNQ